MDVFIFKAPICEHVFCNTCITEWLTSSQTCPIDRTNLTIDALKPAPRILRNFLSRYLFNSIYCRYIQADF